jgi:hypothetical protein
VVGLLITAGLAATCLAATGLTTAGLAAALSGDLGGDLGVRGFAALASSLTAVVLVRVSVGWGGFLEKVFRGGFGPLGCGDFRLGGGLTGRLESSFRDLDLGLRLTGLEATRLLQEKS